MNWSLGLIVFTCYQKKATFIISIPNKASFIYSEPFPFQNLCLDFELQKFFCKQINKPT